MRQLFKVYNDNKKLQPLIGEINIYTEGVEHSAINRIKKAGTQEPRLFMV